MQITDLNLISKDFKIDSIDLYLFNERHTKLLYKSLNELEAIGIAGALNGRIIETIEKKIKNKQTYYKIKSKGVNIGWVSLEDSIRLYRIPPIMGKFTEYNQINMKYIETKYDIQEFQSKLTVANHYFEHPVEGACLIITPLGSSEEILPIEFSSFHRLEAAPKGTVLQVEKGTKLYPNNNYDRVEDELTSDETTQVTGYYKELNEIRIVFAGKKYWIKRRVEKVDTTDKILSDFELIDKIMYLKFKNNDLSNRLKQQEQLNNFIKQNISIDNELQTLFLKRYLGDLNEIK